MERVDILAVINLVLSSKGAPPVADDDTPMRDAGLRSLDFSEVALRIEDQLEYELNFDAASMRRIRTIRDVIDFFTLAANPDAVA